MFSITGSGVRGMIIPSLKYQDPTSQEQRIPAVLDLGIQYVVSDEARERRRDNSQCCYQSFQRYFAKFFISREGHLYGLIFGHMINGYLNTVSRHFQHRAFSENSEISRNPVESSIICSRSCPVQSHPLHAWHHSCPLRHRAQLVHSPPAGSRGTIIYFICNETYYTVAYRLQTQTLRNPT